MMSLNTYSSRMRANAVSRHTLPPWPDPTVADLAAQVFRLHWRTPDGRSRVVHLLAFDEDHAVKVAHLAGVVECYAELKEIAAIDADVSLRADILLHETMAVHAERQQAYEQRGRR